MTRRMAARHFGVGFGAAHVVGADLVHETAAAACGGAGLFDQHFAGVERDGLDRTCRCS